jgi:hypothetical protein
MSDPNPNPNPVGEATEAARAEHVDRRLVSELGPRPERILQFFAADHLPAHLREVSQPFGELAKRLVAELPSNPERTVALRKLLEAKDAAVRARLFVEG